MPLCVIFFFVSLSFQFLTQHLMHRWILRLGVIVTILTIAIDPFSQQLVQLEQGIRYVDEVDGIKATSPYANNYTLGLVEVVNEINSSSSDVLTTKIMDAAPHHSMEIAILSGFSKPMDAIHQQSQSRCPTSNCTWDPFETLGVCHKCNDVTADLERVDNFTSFFNHIESTRRFWNDVWLGQKSTAFSLPNGHFLPNFHGCLEEIGETDDPVCPFHVIAGGTPTFLMTVYGIGNPNKTASMHDLDTMIWSMSTIQMEEFEEGTPEQVIKDIDHDLHGKTRKKGPWDLWPETPVRATECALYYCVKSVEPRIESNIVQEAASEIEGAKRAPNSWQLSTGHNAAPENIPTDLESLEFHEKTSFIPREPLAIHFPDRENGPLYNISSDAVWSINGFFQDSLRDEWDVDDEALELVKDEYLPDAAVMFNAWAELERIQPSNMASIWNRPRTNMSARFDAMATSMTNDIRSVGTPARRPNFFEGEYFTTVESEKMEGRIGMQITSYRIEWYWILLHGAMLLGGVVFCIMTTVLSSARNQSMAAGHSVPVWKNHSLATVSQGTHLAVADAIRGARTISDMEGKAKGTAITMAISEKVPLLDSRDEGADDDTSSERERSSRVAS